MNLRRPEPAAVRPPALGDMHRLRPGPERRARARFLRSVGVAGVLTGIGYCWWRVTVGLPARPGILAWLVMVCEIAPTSVLVRRLFVLWSVDPTVPIPAPVTTAPPGGAAVLLPTYNEPVEVLLPSIAAAVALEPAHDTWVLDDGRRPAVRELAESLGARYATRPDNAHAKAGNLNAWLRARQAAEDLPAFIAVLDCDHVPLPDFLTHTLGYFADPEVALVQVPQAFYNDGSFEHYYGHESFSEQEFFFHVIQRAKNRRGASFWCGSGGVLRTAALLDAGGVATETVCEDLHTTLRLIKAGWKTQYHAEILALGLAPQSAAQYLVQRRRWALGSFQVLLTERLWHAPWLRPGQRFEFLSSILWWFEGLLVIAFFVVPCVLALTGARITDVGLGAWGTAFVISLTSRVWASRALSRNRVRPLSAAVLQAIRCPASLSAVKWLITRTEETFEVTPKGRTAGSRRPRTRVPHVLWGLLAVCNIGMAGLLARAAGWLPGSVNLVTFGIAAFWLAVLAGITLGAIARIRSEQSGSDRRDSYRIAVDYPAGLQWRGQRETIPVRLQDLSATGANIIVRDEPPDVPEMELVLRLADGDQLTVRCAPKRSSSGALGLAALGLQFLPGQTNAQAVISRLLFHGEGAPLQSVPRFRRSPPLHEWSASEAAATDGIAGGRVNVGPWPNPFEPSGAR